MGAKAAQVYSKTVSHTPRISLRIVIERHGDDNGCEEPLERVDLAGGEIYSAARLVSTELDVVRAGATTTGRRLTVRSLCHHGGVDAHVALSDVLGTIPRGERGDRGQGAAPGGVAQAEFHVGNIRYDASLSKQGVSVLAPIEEGNGSAYRSLVLNKLVETNLSEGEGRDELGY